MCKKLFVKCKTINVLLIVLLFFSGCAVTKIPVYQSKSFDPLLVDQITVLPVVDLRIEKPENLTIDKINDWTKITIESRLKKFGYKVNILSDRILVDKLTEDDLSSKDPVWLNEVTSPGSNWILVVGLIDVMSKLTFGSTGNAEVTGYLYNKKDKTVLWHDKGVGKTGQGGLMGMAMKGFMARDAVNIATYDLVSSIPKKPK
jgi:hypothetical protein